MKPSHTDLSRVNGIAGIPIHVFPNPVIPPLNPASPLPLTTLPTPLFLGGGVSFNASSSPPSCLGKEPQIGPFGDWDKRVQLPSPPPGPLPRRTWIPSLGRDPSRTHREPGAGAQRRENSGRAGVGQAGPWRPHHPHLGMKRPVVRAAPLTPPPWSLFSVRLGRGWEARHAGVPEPGSAPGPRPSALGPLGRPRPGAGGEHAGPGGSAGAAMGSRGSHAARIPDGDSIRRETGCERRAGLGPGDAGGPERGRLQGASWMAGAGIWGSLPAVQVRGESGCQVEPGSQVSSSPAGRRVERGEEEGGWPGGSVPPREGVVTPPAAPTARSPGPRRASLPASSCPPTAARGRPGRVPPRVPSARGRVTLPPSVP